MNRSGSGILLALVPWAVLSTPCEAQDDRDVVTDEISVTAVEIPVQVVRRKQPVRGLEKSDFEVYDRGVLQEIVSFEVLDLTRPAVDEAASSALADVASGRARHILLLFDIDFTDWYELPRAVVGARELVAEQLHASDRVAVGFYSAFYGIQLLTDFVTDRQAARLAVDAISGVVERDPEAAGARLHELAELTGLTFEEERVDRETWIDVARKWTTTAQQPIGVGPEDLLAEWELFDAGINSGPLFSEFEIDPVAQAATWSTPLYDERRMRQVRELGRKLADLANRFADLPDPKHVIFLSQGFPSRFIEHPNHTTRVQFRLEEALRAFVETGWVLQAVDVRGAPSIEETAFDGNSLFYLAEETGGWLYENFNKIGVATERLLERSSVTYLLGIQPEVEADGSFHRLEIRLRDGIKGKVFHRPAYRAPRPGDRRAGRGDRRDLAELVLADSEERDFDIEVLTVAVPAVGGRARVPVIIEVPGEVLLAHPFGDNAPVEIHAYGLDASRGIQDLFIKQLDLDLQLERKRLERGGLRFVGHLELAAGACEVRVLVRNLADDAISIARVPVTIERAGESSLVMLPPMFIDRSRDWVSVAAAEAAPSTGGELATLTQMGVEFFPRLRPAFRHNRMQEVLVNFFSNIPESPRLSMRVLGALGQEVDSARIQLVKRWEGEAGGTGVLATLEGKGLEPGGYTLEVSLIDPRSGERTTSTQRFRIDGAS